MRLRKLGPNETEVEIGEYTVFFSYNTPVAYHKAGEGYFRTSQFYSVTTSRHINAWLSGTKALEIPQKDIETVSGFKP